MAYTSEIEKLEARYRENPKGRNFAPLADAYRKAGLIDNAIELCQAGLQIHPDYVSGHIVHGRCLADRKDDTGAEAVFRRVLELDPENILALKVLAEVAERNDRFHDAVEWLNRLLLADPMNGDAAEGLSRVRSKAATTPTQPQPAVPVNATVAVQAEAPIQVEHEELELASGPSGDAANRPPRLSIEHMEGPFSSAIAEDPTTALSRPDFELERTSEPESVAEPEPTTGAESAVTAALDGLESGVDLTVVEAAATGLEGIELEEPAAPIPVTPLAIEGLARTQYEGSGLFGVERGAAPESPESAPGGGVEASPAVDLPLIMPEDVAPPTARPEPVTEPVPALRLPDDDGAADTEALSQVEPVVTETMAELYLKQGHREDALRVYEALSARRPEDSRLQEKVAGLRTAAPRPSGGSQTAAAFLRGIFGARLGAPAPAPLTPPPAPLTPPPAPPPPPPAPPPAADLVTSEEELAPGTPTRPAADAISLDSVFGDEGGRGSMPVIPALSEAAPDRPSKLPGASGGFSFDDFFGTAGPASGGGKGAAPSARPARPSGRTRSPEQDEDLDQFQAWLKSLKA